MSRKKKKGDLSEERFRDFAAKVGEHFADYVLVVRIEGGLRWKHSDSTFAQGACRRVSGFLAREDVDA